MSRAFRTITLLVAGVLMLTGHTAWARDDRDPSRRLFGLLPQQPQQQAQYPQDPTAGRGYADPRYGQPRYVDPRNSDPRYGYGYAQPQPNPRSYPGYQNDAYGRGYYNADPRYTAPRAVDDNARGRTLLPGMLAPSQRDHRQESYGLNADQAAREIQSRHGGRVLSVQPDGPGYRVKTLKDGEVRIYQVYP